MKLLKPWFCLAAILVLALFRVAPALADTYNIVNLNTDEAAIFYGMDASGDVVMTSNAENNGSCTVQFPDCYQTYVNGIQTASTSTPPIFTPDNGTPCTPSVPSGVTVFHAVCNDGREAFLALFPGQSMANVYTGPDPLAILAGNGTGDFIFMNSAGDIVWNDPRDEFWFEAFDQTSAVPEPSSFLLLGTGSLAALGAMRRRFQQR